MQIKHVYTAFVKLSVTVTTLYILALVCALLCSLHPSNREQSIHFFFFFTMAGLELYIAHSKATKPQTRYAPEEFAFRSSRNGGRDTPACPWLVSPTLRMVLNPFPCPVPASSARLHRLAAEPSPTAPGERRPAADRGAGSSTCGRTAARIIGLVGRTHGRG
jgi:hypothetical protein